MVNESIIVNTLENGGTSALEELFKKLSKEDALKGIGILTILGVSALAIKAVVDIVKLK